VNIEDQARTRLIRVDSATSLEDLRVHRGNRLEALSGDRKGQFRIRINDHGLAQAIRVPANRISLIVNEKRGITADTAARLARYFGNSPQYWLNIQNRFDLDSIDQDAIERDVIPRQAA